MVSTPYGTCIYCGVANPSTDEHVVPYALNGDLILKRASCTSCAAITSKFEQDIVRDLLGAVRLYRDMKSRGGHKNTKPQVPVRLLKGSTWENVFWRQHGEHYLPSSLVRGGPSQCSASVLSPRGFCHLCFFLGIGTTGSRSSMQKPESASRPLYAGRRLPSNQVSGKLVAKDCIGRPCL